MRPFHRRRLIGSLAVALATATTWAVAQRMEHRLQRSAEFTGWTLLAVVALLALFNLRKKLPALPLGSASTWLQAHIYLGFFSAGLFALHAGAWPRGCLETSLAALYLATFASGLVGLWWTRTLPRKLAQVGEEVAYERIAPLRGRLRDQAQAAVLSAVRTDGAATLGQFYSERLHDYFSTRRGWGYRLRPTSALRKELLAELTAAARYLSEGERQVAEQLFALVRQRDDLDYHEALQWRLRAWLFLHIGLTYPLLAAAAVHAWLACLFRGSGL